MRNLFGGRRQDPVRALRALRAWASALGEDWDWRPYEGRGYWHWKIPVGRALVSGKGARLAIQSRCAQVLIDVSGARVVAIINLPDMFGSEVCVFFDEAFFEGFAPRDSEDHTWTPIDDSLARRWNLRPPKGFGEVGYRTVTRDTDYGSLRVEEGEVWMIGDV